MQHNRYDQQKISTFVELSTCQRQKAEQYQSSKLMLEFYRIDIAAQSTDDKADSAALTYYIEGGL